MYKMVRQLWIFGKPIFTDWTSYIEKLKDDEIDIKFLDDNEFVKYQGIKIPSTSYQSASIYPEISESYDICRNKVKFQQFMTNCPELQKYIPPTVYDNNTPCFVKKDISIGGIDVTFVNNIQKNTIDRKKYAVQECINYNVNWVGHFSIVKGVIQYSIYYKNDKKIPIGYVKRGNIVDYVIENDNIYESVFQTIFKKLNYTGFASFDFCTDLKTNDLKIFEINPRFGGSILRNTNHLKKSIISYIKAFHLTPHITKQSI